MIALQTTRESSTIDLDKLEGVKPVFKRHGEGVRMLGDLSNKSEKTGRTALHHSGAARATAEENKAQPAAMDEAELEHPTEAEVGAEAMV